MIARILRCAAVAGTLALPALAMDESPAAIALRGDRTREHLLLPDLPVTDSTGHRQGFVSRYADAGPVLIAFLYTNCTEYCGLTISVLGIVDMLLQEPGAPRLRVVAISIDPRRDTPQVLAEMAGLVQASPRWDWVVASPADTPTLLQAFGLPTGPLEQHPATYLLGDLRSGLFQRLPGDAQPEDLLALARQLR
ncbi:MULTISPECIES: SCO family protein [unclassified Paracoccus (in: a-proteobacteria)]|uniref:SCO family protein n=1 Tax=unclassified Paracoccus (in: a-proteobacteria) TaxID=2688777 RepID=UPI0012B20BA1|nr:MULTISPECIES: SCO family protein [unclassified Paracoccus (in: a-proteobacteria)]UXU76528.1 SCO family protein [Paracoccus sp. SMMA_5]UXU82405.1 SCO family protein [Paracoccus sp. SMMA_5_TC]